MQVIDWVPEKYRKEKMKSPQILVNRLSDGKLSCCYGDTEFYLLPSKKECDPDHIEKAFIALYRELNLKVEELKEW